MQIYIHNKIIIVDQFAYNKLYATIKYALETRVAFHRIIENKDIMRVRLIPDH